MNQKQKKRYREEYLKNNFKYKIVVYNISKWGILCKINKVLYRFNNLQTLL